METENSLNQKILATTKKIREEFPELIKYLEEVPTKFSSTESKGIDIENLKDYNNSLTQLLENYAKEQSCLLEFLKNEKPDSHILKKMGVKDDTLSYPASEDIYNKAKEETEINPEDITKKKMPNENTRTKNEKDFQDDKSGKDLDVPGSELDDKQEKIGSEDEENNYYSIGGDRHNDLDEDNN